MIKVQLHEFDNEVVINTSMSEQVRPSVRTSGCISIEVRGQGIVDLNFDKPETLLVLAAKAATLASQLVTAIEEGKPK